jgi:hypothetical protein
MFHLEFTVKKAMHINPPPPPPTLTSLPAHISGFVISNCYCQIDQSLQNKKKIKINFKFVTAFFS